MAPPLVVTASVPESFIWLDVDLGRDIVRPLLRQTGAHLRHPEGLLAS